MNGTLALVSARRGAAVFDVVAVDVLAPGCDAPLAVFFGFSGKVRRSCWGTRTRGPVAPAAGVPAAAAAATTAARPMAAARVVVNMLILQRRRALTE